MYTDHEKSDRYMTFKVPKGLILLVMSEAAV